MFSQPLLISLGHEAAVLALLVAIFQPRGGHSLIFSGGHTQRFLQAAPPGHFSIDLDFPILEGPIFEGGTKLPSSSPAEFEVEVKERSLAITATTTIQPLSSPSGVVCQTLLHSAVRNQHFKRMAESCLGQELGQKFDVQLENVCHQAFTPSAWQTLFQGYTGSRDANHVADPDNYILSSMGIWLNHERKQMNQKATAWSDFRNGHQDTSPVTGLLAHIASTPPQVSLTRIMDFGCGDGIEVAKVGRGLGLAKIDVYGLDVYSSLSSTVSSNVTFMLANAGSAAEYSASLTGLLDSQGLRGTVSAVFSQVTFHHITDSSMRTSALDFIRNALHDDGFFVLSEWDNVGTPIDYSIYFDLDHVLPSMYFSDNAPETFDLAFLDTEYLSLQGWIDLATQHSLSYTESRSNLTSQDGTLLTPFQVAERTVGRNFHAVFEKSTSTA